MEPGTTEHPTAITNITEITVVPHSFSTVWYHVLTYHVIYTFTVVVVTTVTHPCHYTGKISHHYFTIKDNVKTQHTTALHIYECHSQET